MKTTAGWWMRTTCFLKVKTLRESRECGGQSKATPKGSLVSLSNEKKNGARMQGGGRCKEGR
jgi:hypothetical protein